MRREDAEAQRQRLQQQDEHHTYLVRERAEGGDWEVVHLDLPHRASDVRAERGKPSDSPDDPRPSLIRQIPPYGPPA